MRSFSTAVAEHDDREAFASLADDAELKALGVETGGIVYFTNPLCIDISWPDVNEDGVYARFESLGFHLRGKRPQIIRRPLPPISIPKKRPLELEAVLQAGGGLNEHVRIPVKLDYSTDRQGWFGTVPKQVEFLTSLHINGKDITHLSISSGCMTWGRDEAPTDKIDIHQPAGIVWPLMLDSFYHTHIFVRAREDTEPELAVEHAKVCMDTKKRLFFNKIWSFAFNGGGAIAMWQSGLNGTLLVPGLTKQEIAPHIDRLRAQYLLDNADIDKEPTEEQVRWEITEWRL